MSDAKPYRDPRGWPFDEHAPLPAGCAVFEGEALDALIDYARLHPLPAPKPKRTDRSRT